MNSITIISDSLRRSPFISLFKEVYFSLINKIFQDRAGGRKGSHCTAKCLFPVKRFFSKRGNWERATVSKLRV